jgi:peptidoglycan/xylan/chitin deacetylase (PgdA/CDA1 family)
LILLYHRVAELAADPWRLSVSPRHFAEHLEVLREHGRILRLEQLVAGLRAGELPDGAVVVTFDDGYGDNLDQAKPLLERYDSPATFFITTGYLDQEREFWWDELERLLLEPGELPDVLELRIGGTVHRWDLGEAASMSEEAARHHRGWIAWSDPPTPRHQLFQSLWDQLRSTSESERNGALDHLRNWVGGEQTPRASHRTLTAEEVLTLARDDLVEIGAHTATHPSLAALPLEGQRQEMVLSKERLEKLLGRRVSSFAYPFGGRAQFSAETVLAAQGVGFQSACTTVDTLVTPSADPFELPRFQVRDWDGDEFAATLSDWLHS